MDPTPSFRMHKSIDLEDKQYIDFDMQHRFFYQSLIQTDDTAVIIDFRDSSILIASNHPDVDGFVGEGTESLRQTPAIW